jgi:hypothetical protein
MTCKRCGGLMVSEAGWGWPGGAESFSNMTRFLVWRCLLCGNAYDPEIEINRLRSASSDATRGLNQGHRAQHRR